MPAMQLFAVNQDGNRFCGPSIISALAGIGTKDAAAILRDISRRAAIKGTHTKEVRGALARLGFTLSERPSPSGNLRSWARKHAHGSEVYLVAAANHWILIQAGYAICGKTINLVNIEDHPNARGFVTEAYKVTKQANVDAATAVPESQPKRQASARQKALRLAAKYGFECARDNGLDSKAIGVFPPAGLYANRVDDPYFNDGNYTDSWVCALARAQTYAAAVQTAAKALPMSSTAGSTRSRACALAAQHAITIEQDAGGNNTIWIYPPDAISEEDDPFSDEHYVDTWHDALSRVELYARMAAKIEH